MHSSLKFLAATAMVAAFAMPAQAAVKVGTLDCDISGGVGMVITSQKGVRCTFTPTTTRRPEIYAGAITKFGLDVGVTSGGRMIWAVYAPTTDKLRGALSGNYAGASAEATIGVGPGANALVGGSNQTITLQPISIQGQAGLNLAVGVAGLRLNQARR